MTNEERDLITRFIERVTGAGAASQGSGGQGLAPVDHDADGLIGELFGRYPEARYRITQLAFVQEHALGAAQQRIAELQAALQQAQQAQQTGAQGGASPWGGGSQPAQGQSRGFFSSLFGGGQPASPPQGQPYPPQQPPPPQYPPQYPQQPYGAPQAGMFQPQGTGFLGGALRTAAGVAGGVVAGEALMNLFEGNRGGGLFGGGGGFGSQTAGPTIIEENNSPWGAPGGGGFAPDPYDQGGAPKDAPAADQYADNTAWQPAPDQPVDQGGGDGGWQPAPDDSGFGSNDDSGGWTDSSGDA